MQYDLSIVVTNHLRNFKKIITLTVVFLFFSANIGNGLIMNFTTSVEPSWVFSTESDVVSVDVSDNGQYIAVGSFNNKLHLLDRYGSEQWSAQVPVNDPWSSISTRTVRISSNGDYIAAGGLDNKIYLFDNNGTKLWDKYLGSNINAIDLSKKANWIVAGTQSGNIYYFSKDSNNSRWCSRIGSPIQSIAISNNGENIVVGNSKGSVHLFDSDGRNIWSYQLQYGNYVITDISDDGTKIVAATDDRSNKLGCILACFSTMKDGKSGWSKADGIPLWYKDYSASENDFRDVAISADGGYICCCGNGVSTCLYDINGTPILNNLSNDCRLSLSDQGEYFACGKKSVNYYSRHCSKPIWTFNPDSDIHSMSISASGDLIIIGCEDGKVYALKGQMQPKIDSVAFTNYLQNYYERGGKVVYKRGINSVNFYVLIDESKGEMIEEHQIKLFINQPSIRITSEGFTEIDGKKAKRFTMDIENNAPVGKYTMVVKLTYCEGEIDEFDKDFFVIFNVGTSGNSEYVNNSNQRKVFVNNTTSVWWSIPDDGLHSSTTIGYAVPYNTEHFSNLVFTEHSINIVNGMTSPEQAVVALNVHLHTFLRFRENVIYHSFSDMIYNNSGFCECSSWANALVAMLRSIGIASRPVTLDCDARFSEWHFDTATELFYDGCWRVILGRSGNQATPMERHELPSYSTAWAEESGDVIITANENWPSNAEDIGDDEPDYKFDRTESNFYEIKPWVDSLSEEYWGAPYHESKLNIRSRIKIYCKNEFPLTKCIYDAAIAPPNKMFPSLSSKFYSVMLGKEATNIILNSSTSTDSITNNKKGEILPIIRNDSYSSSRKYSSFAVTNTTRVHDDFTYANGKYYGTFDDPPHVQLIHPKGGEELSDLISIQWIAEYSESWGSPNIWLHYSADGGCSWIEIDRDLQNNVGEYQHKDQGEYCWDASCLTDGNYLVSIYAYYNSIEMISNTSDPFLKTSYHNTDTLVSYVTLSRDDLSISYLKDGDCLKIQAGINRASALILEDVAADLSCLGLGSAVPPDNFDGLTATWYVDMVKCKPDNGILTITILVGEDGINATLCADNTPPLIYIEKPEDALYLNNIKLFGLNKPVIIGEVTVNVCVEELSGIKKIEYYLDNDLKKVSTDDEWVIDLQLLGKYTMTIVVYDNVNNTNAISKEMIIINIS